MGTVINKAKTTAQIFASAGQRLLEASDMLVAAMQAAERDDLGDGPAQLIEDAFERATSAANDAKDAIKMLMDRAERARAA